jgi:nitroimidazol reductase NimA-like FMN-containing flavoprotein (pyridoxamine 5'-phosphate oxidase superfamily)
MVSDLLGSQLVGVLSTNGAYGPYASLVAFAASNDLKHLVFATHRKTRKYANLSRESRVAFLVDNRNNRPSDTCRSAGVTALGRAEALQAQGKAEWLTRYLQRQPHLEEFIRSPGSVLVRIQVQRYLLVSHFQDVVELEMTE